MNKRMIVSDSLKGFHGIVGTPTNMYDCRGNMLHVGDIVDTIVMDSNGVLEDCYGLSIVAEEDPEVVSYTHTKYKYIDGIANTFNSNVFSKYPNIYKDGEFDYETIRRISHIDNSISNSYWYVKLVKAYDKLVENETCGWAVMMPEETWVNANIDKREAYEKHKIESLKDIGIEF